VAHLTGPGWLVALLGCLVLDMASLAQAQQTLPYGLPPPAGSQNPALPPVSGSQNPVLPPPSGSRYAPGTGGRWGDETGRPVRPAPPQPAPRDIVGMIDGSSTPLAVGASVNRLSEIAPAIGRCWVPPPLPGNVTGGMVTVRFSLRRNGSVIGTPRVTWQSGQMEPAMENRLKASALEAVAKCAPLNLSSGLGGSIAGRPISLRFHLREPAFQGAT
jgi:hypothetical protein